MSTIDGSATGDLDQAVDSITYTDNEVDNLVWKLIEAETECDSIKDKLDYINWQLDIMTAKYYDSQKDNEHWRQEIDAAWKHVDRAVEEREHYINEACRDRDAAREELAQAIQEKERALAEAKFWRGKLLLTGQKLVSLVEKWPL
ncbi:hypothetical protein VKT23_008241 [Stygiomarasmius scandens]|uniref:Uncharacterized protein n=1 Tax=Marasmiellus scandens TaxID=2682957 RepID=A0ABR1JMB3_9AGAR